MVTEWSQICGFKIEMAIDGELRLGPNGMNSHGIKAALSYDTDL